MTAESRLLYDTRPLVVNPKLAKLVGLDEALILHQVHYWVNINKSAEKNWRDGYYWTYNTFKEWAEQFPFWSVSTIKRIVKKLQERKLLIVGNFNRMNLDRTKWYRINHELLIELEAPLCQVDTMQSVKVALPLGQSDTIGEPVDSVKLTPPIPETNSTEINTETKGSEIKAASSKPPALHKRPIFAAMQKELGYPDRTDKDPIPNYGKEAKAIDRMKKRGYSEDDILAAWKTKVRARSEFVSMTWVNEDIGKPQRPSQARMLPKEDELVAQAREKGLVK